MLLESLLAFFLGILAGTFTGLSPGIHINLVAAFLLASINRFSSINPLSLVIFIVSMSITHTFVDFIPSIFLAAPDEDTFLSVLPGHKLLQQGKAHQAVVLSLVGALVGIFLAILITPLFSILIPYLFNLIKTLIPFILISVSLYLIFREDKIIPGIITFTLSGIIGLLAFNLPVKEPLMPLLTGLFGLSSLLVSIKNKQTSPKQKIESIRSSISPIKKLVKPSLVACFIAPFCSFLPGIGSGHAGVISSEIIETDNRTFLFLIGAISTIVMSLSFVTTFAIQKARTGSAAAVQEILKFISLNELIIILIVIVISAFLAFIISINLSKIATKFFNIINYKLLNIAVILILLTAVLFISNFQGIIVLLTSASLGIYTVLSGTKRINLMGCLLIPSIVYYILN